MGAGGRAALLARKKARTSRLRPPSHALRGLILYCGSQTLVKHAPDYRQAISLRCRSWGCAECEPQRRRQLIAQAIGGDPNTFITLTLPADRARDAEHAVKDLSRAWRVIRKRDARRRKGKPVPFIAVVEKTKAGTPHLHILCRARWIDQKWLSDCMAELLDAPIVHVKRIDNRGRVVGYCAKYCGKDSAKVGTNKRYWQSRDYSKQPKRVKTPLGPDEFYGQPWDYGIKRTVNHFVEMGWIPTWLSTTKCDLHPPDR